MAVNNGTQQPACRLVGSAGGGKKKEKEKELNMRGYAYNSMSVRLMSVLVFVCVPAYLPTCLSVCVSVSVPDRSQHCHETDRHTIVGIPTHV